MKVLVQYECRDGRGIRIDSGRRIVEAESVQEGRDAVMSVLPGYVCLVALQQFADFGSGSYTAGLHGLHGDDADA